MSILVGMLGMNARIVVGQDFRRMFQHRNVWVENIGACPTPLIDRIIDRFQNEGFRVRLINVNPDVSKKKGNCYQNSVFMVFVHSEKTEFTYPGYTRYTDQNGTFVAQRGDFEPDFPFSVNDSTLRVVEIIGGKMFMTKMNSHGIRQEQGARLYSADLRKIVQRVHDKYRPDKNRKILSALHIRSKEPNGVIVSFKDFADRERTYELIKSDRNWGVVSSPEESEDGLLPFWSGG